MLCVSAYIDFFASLIQQVSLGDERRVSKIMAWFEEMRVYEVKGVAKKGSGLRRPDDLILDDEYVQPEARGHAWTRYEFSPKSIHKSA